MDQTRFWIEFEADEPAHGSRLPTLGVGVTAWTEEDALALVADAFQRPVHELPPASRVVADIDVSTLDPGHVMPGVGDPSRRGVWYPRMQADH